MNNDDHGSITNGSVYIKLSEIEVESFNDQNEGVHLTQNLLPSTGDTFLFLPITDLTP